MTLIDTEDFRSGIIVRIAKCLLGALERGHRPATFKIPRVLTGVNLVVDCDLAQLSKSVEFSLNEQASLHHNHTLHRAYKVSVNTLNGVCHFTAHVHA